VRLLCIDSELNVLSATVPSLLAIRREQVVRDVGRGNNWAMGFAASLNLLKSSSILLPLLCKTRYFLHCLFRRGSPALLSRWWEVPVYSPLEDPLDRLAEQALKKRAAELEARIRVHLNETYIEVVCIIEHEVVAEELEAVLP